MTGAAQLTARATKLARKGHPWFFADDVAALEAGDGDLVVVVGADGAGLGVGFCSMQSRIRLRLCGPGPGGAAAGADGGAADGADAAGGAVDATAFFAARIAAAVARRAALRGPGRGVRLVHSEADGLPGLVADEYGDCVVVQVTAAAVERHLDCVVPALVEHCGAQTVLARNDVGARRFEGLPREVRLLHGRRVEQVSIEEHGVRHEVRVWEGHKTGFYLDQRPARGRVLELAAGRRVLDLFCYQGGFALAALAGGAASALAVDQSADALARCVAGAAANGLAGLEPRAANVFDELRALRGADERFDLVVVDPPAFAKSRREQRGGERGYRDLNRHAMRLLAPGGYLVTCSCSHHVARTAFEDVLRQGAADLPFRVLLRERLMAGEDHPVWLNHPESEYLKVCVLQRAE